jgi:hypothetical protein
MGFFQRLFSKDKEWKLKLEEVDFLLARNELARIFAMQLSNAKEEGSVLIIKKEFDDVLGPFMSNPCLETAINLLKIAPYFYEFFEGSKPGGLYWRIDIYSDMLNRS